MRQLVEINDRLFVFFSLDFMAAMKVETFQSKGQLLICIRILIIILIIEPHNNTLYFSAIEFCTIKAPNKKLIISLKNECITYPLQILDKKQYLQ